MQTAAKQANLKILQVLSQDFFGRNLKQKIFPEILKSILETIPKNKKQTVIIRFPSIIDLKSTWKDLVGCIINDDSEDTVDRICFVLAHKNDRGYIGLGNCIILNGDNLAAYIETNIKNIENLKDKNIVLDISIEIKAQ